MGNRGYRRKVTEEHSAMVAEPGLEYLGPYSPATGSAKSIDTGLKKFLN